MSHCHPNGTDLGLWWPHIGEMNFRWVYTFTRLWNFENGKTTIRYTLRAIYVYYNHSMYTTRWWEDVMFIFLYMYSIYWKRENVKFSSSPYTKYLRLILYGILNYLEKEIDALARRQTKWGKQGAHTEYMDGDTMDGWYLRDGGEWAARFFWGK